MGDSSDEEFSNEWIPYVERSEWKDVTPLEQEDGDNPVVMIAYSEKCLFIQITFIIIICLKISIFLCSQRCLQLFSSHSLQPRKKSTCIEINRRCTQVKRVQLYSLAISVQIVFIFLFLINIIGPEIKLIKYYNSQERNTACCGYGFVPRARLYRRYNNSKSEKLSSMASSTCSC